MTLFKKKGFKVGDDVVVRTCSGEHGGKIRAVRPWGGVSNDQTPAYEVSGPGIITTTKTVRRPVTGEKLFKGSTCRLCPTQKDCCFREL